MNGTGTHVEYEVEDDGGLLYDVERMPSGGLTAKFRVYAHVIIDGKQYECDRGEVRIALQRSND